MSRSLTIHEQWALRRRADRLRLALIAMNEADITDRLGWAMQREPDPAWTDKDKENFRRFSSRLEGLFDDDLLDDILPQPGVASGMVDEEESNVR